MTTSFSSTVIADTDNAIEAAGSVTTGGTSSGTIDATTEYIGLRFRSVNIPQGAWIRSAVLNLTPTASTDDEPLCPIGVCLHENAPAFVTGASDLLSARTLTPTIMWDDSDLAADGTTQHDTVGLAAGVQTVIDQPGWTSGNAMAFVIQGSVTATRDLDIIFFGDATALYRPHLNIEWELRTIPDGGTMIYSRETPRPTPQTQVYR